MENTIVNFRQATIDAFDALIQRYRMELVEHEDSWFEIRGTNLCINLTWDRGSVECDLTLPNEGFENIPVLELFRKVSRFPEPPRPVNTWSLPDVLNWYASLVEQGIIEQYSPR